MNKECIRDDKEQCEFYDSSNKCFPICNGCMYKNIKNVLNAKSKNYYRRRSK